jgi:hypothetical protein
MPSKYLPGTSQVARQRSGGVLALEDGGAVDHWRERIGGKRVEDVSAGIGDAESSEGRSDGLPHDWILARLERAPGGLLAAEPLRERSARLSDLLRRGLVGVEIHAAPAAAIGARAMVERARPGGDDPQAEQLTRCLALGRGGEHERRQHLEEEAKGPFDVALVLRAALGGRDEQRRVTERRADLGHQVGRPVVHEHGPRGGAPVVAFPSSTASMSAALSSSSRIDAPVKAPEYASTVSSKLKAKRWPRNVTTTCVPSATHCAPGKKVSKDLRRAVSSGERPSRRRRRRTPCAARMAAMADRL